MMRAPQLDETANEREFAVIFILFAFIGVHSRL